MTNRFGTISVTEIWADGDVITGDVTIDGTGNVTVPAGATILWDAAVTANLRITILAGGAMRWQGTSSSRCLLKSNKGSPTITDAFGIDANATGAIFESSFTTFQHATQGLFKPNSSIGPIIGTIWDTCDIAIFGGFSYADPVATIVGTAAARNSIVNCDRPVLAAPGVTLKFLDISPPNLDARFGITLGAEPTPAVSGFTEMDVSSGPSSSVTLEEVTVTGGTVSLHRRPFDDVNARIDITNLTIDVNQRNKSPGGIPYDYWLYIEFVAFEFNNNLLATRVCEIDGLIIKNYTVNPTQSESGNAFHLKSRTNDGYQFNLQNFDIEVGNIAFKWATGIALTDFYHIFNGVFRSPNKYHALFPLGIYDQIVIDPVSLEPAGILEIGDKGPVEIGLVGERIVVLKSSAAVLSNRGQINFKNCTMQADPLDGEKLVFHNRQVVGILFEKCFINASIPATYTAGMILIQTASTFGGTDFIDTIINVDVALGYSGSFVVIKAQPVNASAVPIFISQQITRCIFSKTGDVRFVQESISVSSGSLYFGNDKVGAGGMFDDPWYLTMFEDRISQFPVGVSMPSGTLFAGSAILCSVFVDNVKGIRITNIGAGFPSIIDNSFEGNDQFGIENIGFTLLAENNWWGAADGPSGVGPGSGDAVSTAVDFTPFRTSRCRGLAIVANGIDITDRIKTINLGLEPNAVSTLKLMMQDFDDAFAFSDLETQLIEIRTGLLTIFTGLVDRPRATAPQAVKRWWELNAKDLLTRARRVVVPNLTRYNYTNTPLSTIVKEMIFLVSSRFGLGLWWDGASIPTSGVSVDFDARDRHVLNILQALARRSGDEDLMWWVDGERRVYFRGQTATGDSVVAKEVGGGSWHERNFEHLANHFELLYNQGLSRELQEDLVSQGLFGQFDDFDSDDRITLQPTAEARAKGELARKSEIIITGALVLKPSLERFTLRDVITATAPIILLSGTFQIVKIKHELRFILSRDEPAPILRGDTIINLGRPPVNLRGLLTSERDD